MSKHLSPRAERPALWRRFGSVRLRAFFALGVLGVAGATGTTFAAWTDSAAITGTSLTAGSIDLKLTSTDQDNVTGYTALNIANLVPGNSVAATVLVKNKGTAPLKYTLASAVTNPDGKGLGTTLTYTVTTGSVTGTAPSATCGGTVVATGNLGGAMISTGRLLAATTGSETVCLQISLPSNANTNLQGATTGVTFTFTGTSDLA